MAGEMVPAGGARRTDLDPLAMDRHRDADAKGAADVDGRVTDARRSGCGQRSRGWAEEPISVSPAAVAGCWPTRSTRCWCWDRAIREDDRAAWIPMAMAASGALVSASTKPDVMEATLAARSEVGQAWLFDPSGTETLPDGVRRLSWSPVRGGGDWDGAARGCPRDMTAATRTGAGTTNRSLVRARAERCWHHCCTRQT